MYGAWIKPNGDTVIVERQCEHTRFCDYGDADKEGWIATVEPPMDRVELSFCARYNRKTVTKDALRTLMGRWKDQELDLIAEGIYMRPTYFGMGIKKGRGQTMAFLRDEIRNARNLKDPIPEEWDEDDE